MYKRKLPEGYQNVTNKNAFELRYLRWDFLVKASNPPTAFFDIVDPIIRSESNYAFCKWNHIFKHAGIEKEDLENISRVHAIYCYEIYFLDLFNESTDIEKIKLKAINNRSFLKTKFLIKQRLSEVAELCRKKNSYSVGYSTIKLYYTNIQNNMSEEEARNISIQDTKAKWRPASLKMAASIKKEVGSFYPGQCFIKNDKLFKVVSNNESTCDLDSVYDILENTNAYSVSSAEKTMLDGEVCVQIENAMNFYDCLNNKQKADWLTNLISQVKKMDNSKRFYKEIMIIKRKIKKLLSNTKES